MTEPEKKVLTEQICRLKGELEETGVQRQYEEAMEVTIQAVREAAEELESEYDREIVSSITGRIKKAESIQRKLCKKGCTVNVETAVCKLHDIAGVRAACFFLDDVYALAKRLKENDKLHVLKEKNYIENPKNSGYKSLHLIVEMPLKEKMDIRYVKVEIQLRTLAMDFWADLDHRLCYKRECKEVSEIQNNLREYAEIISRVDGQMNRLLHRII